MAAEDSTYHLIKPLEENRACVQRPSFAFRTGLWYAKGRVSIIPPTKEDYKPQACPQHYPLVNEFGLQELAHKRV